MIKLSKLNVKRMSKFGDTRVNGIFLIIIYMGEFKKISNKINKIEQSRLRKGELIMSEIIKDLVGEQCVIQGNYFVDFTGTVLDVDEEWIKVLCVDKKKTETIIIKRIEDIKGIKIDKK